MKLNRIGRRLLEQAITACIQQALPRAAWEWGQGDGVSALMGGRTVKIYIVPPTGGMVVNTIPASLSLRSRGSGVRVAWSSPLPSPLPGRVTRREEVVSEMLFGDLKSL